jgi:E3 ubiquitin-protein ligase RNF14
MHNLEVSDDTLKHLLVYNKEASLQVFQQGTYECGICLDPKKRSLCYRIEDCKHCFCIECLQGYFNNAILTDNIHSVKYPAFNCRNKPAERARVITPRELLRVPIERPAVHRYVDLKRKKKLESEASTIWCSRQWCQGAVKGNKYPRPDVSPEDMGVVFEDDAETWNHK